MLIDLENIVRNRDSWLPTDEAEDLLRRALDMGERADFRIAIAPAGVLRRYAGALVRLRLACEVVPAGPGAADLALLAHCQHLASVGYGRFVVLSGDHVFVEVCRRHPTTVIVRHGQPVARILRQTAIAVLAA